MAANTSVSCVAGVCLLGACNMGFHDCDSKVNTGCECEGTLCCGNGCQVKHSNGLGQNYFNCSTVGTPGNQNTYSLLMATDARDLWPFQGSLLTGACARPGGKATCLAKQAANGCAVWCYTNDGNQNPIAGRVNLNTVTMSMGLYSCICPTTQSPSWN